MWQAWLLLALAASLHPAVPARGASRRAPLKAARRGPPRAAPVVLSPGDTVSINGALYTVGYSLSPLAAPAPPPAPKLIGLTTNGPTFSAGAILSGTVTLDSAAPVSGAVVTLTSSQPAVLPVAAAVTVAPGATLAPFTATAGRPQATTSVTVTATLGGTPP